MRNTSRLAVIGALVAALAACSSGDGGPTIPVAGVAAVPGAPADTPLFVAVVSLDGEVLAEGAATADGAFALTARPPGGVRRLLVTAVAPTAPERRAFALVNADLSTDAADVVVRALSAARGDEPAAGDALRVDADSTATALVAAASGDLTQDLGTLRTRHGAAIDAVAAELADGTFPVCSVDATTTAGGYGPMQNALAGVTNDALPADPTGEPLVDSVPDLIRELVTESRRDRPIEQRLRNMQRMISQVVYSLNNPRMTAYQDYLWGVMPTVLLRTTVWATTQEEATGLSDAPLPRSELNRLAGMIAGIKWGNCREKAYMGAFAASLIPDLKQVAVVGMETATGGSHALAIACLDGPDVFDLSQFGGGPLGGDDFSLPAGAEGRCFVVDPWQGPADDLTAGHTEVLDEFSAERWGWALVDVVKVVVLEGQPLVLSAALTASLDCGGVAGGGCGTFAPPVAPVGPDAGDDAGAGTRDVAEPAEDVLECPTYEPDGEPCGGSQEGCIEGFYCSRQTVACEQEECPEGARRTYTLECCCDCWDDKSLRTVYDPCRTGFVLRCEPR